MRPIRPAAVACVVLAAACGTTPAPTGPSAASRSSAPATSATTTPTAGRPTWAGPFNTSPHNLQNVSCPTVQFCLATDDNTDFVWDGTQWKPQTTPFSGNKAPVALDCFDDGTCLAGNNVAHIEIYRAGAWSITSNTLFGRGAWIFSCASSSFCLVSNEGSYTIYTYDGHNFSLSATDTAEAGASNAVPPPSGDPVDFWVACGSGSSSTCIWVDGLGNASAYSRSTSRWSPVTNIDPGHGFFRTTCVPGADTCFAWDTGGAMFGFDGLTWTKLASSLPADAYKNFQRPYFSCPTRAFCMATNTSQAFVYNGTSWILSPGLVLASNQVPSVSCASATFCVVADLGGALWTYHGT